jgi:hypothetical protein
MRLLTASLLVALATAVAGGSVHTAAAAFPGQNGKIAFASNRTGAYDIYAADPDGGALVDLTSTAGIDELDPAWSPDGRRVAFARDGAIWIMDGSGGGQAQLTVGAPAGEIDSGPAWSPSGSELAFGRRDSSGNTGIWIVSVGTGTQQQVTARTGDVGQDRFPSWSPDGSTIAFQRDTRGQASRLALVSSAGGAVQIVDTGVASSNAHPAWSPDGTKIAIDVNGGEGIAIFEPSGTRIPLPESITPLFGSDPEWSPDGIAIVATDTGDIVWTRLDGGGSTTVTAGAADDRSPSWQAAPTAPPPNTPAGAGVTVALGPVTITFASVFQPGTTSAVPSSAGPPVPSFFQVASDYYELATTATWDTAAGAQVCFAYAGSTAPQIVHFVGGVATTVPTTTGPGPQVCGTVSSFSPFVLVRPAGDTTAPTLSLPANLVGNATSPAGAAVGYTASVSDDVDPSPSVTCVPASGSVFSIGVTTVACAAVDASGNRANGSFTVTVKGAKDQLADLIQKVVGETRLPSSTKTALIAKLNQLLASFDPSNATQRQAACLALQVFKAAVQLLSGKTLPTASAGEWIADANRIRAVLGC